MGCEYPRDHLANALAVVDDEYRANRSLGSGPRVPHLLCETAGVDQHHRFAATEQCDPGDDRVGTGEQWTEVLGRNLGQIEHVVHGEGDVPGGALEHEHL